MINISNFRSVMCAQSVRSENRLVGMKITISYERLAKKKSKDEIIKAGDVEGGEMRRTDDLYLIYIYIYPWVYIHNDEEFLARKWNYY